MSEGGLTRQLAAQTSAWTTNPFCWRRFQGQPWGIAEFAIVWVLPGVPISWVCMSVLWLSGIEEQAPSVSAVRVKTRAGATLLIYFFIDLSVVWLCERNIRR